jgi:hypothetical protein
MYFSLLNYFNNHPLHVSNRLTVHHQEFHSDRASASQRRWMINKICCIYSKLPPDDEQLIYSKHVEDGY